MKNKVLIELVVPCIEETYSVYLPLSKKIGNIIVLLNKSLKEITNDIYVGSDEASLYNKDTGIRYDINETLYKTDIKNGTTLILL